MTDRSEPTTAACGHDTIHRRVGRGEDSGIVVDAWGCVDCGNILLERPEAEAAPITDRMALALAVHVAFGIDWTDEQIDAVLASLNANRWYLAIEDEARSLGEAALLDVYEPAVDDFGNQYLSPLTAGPVPYHPTVETLLMAIETMDQKITPYGEREDGTIQNYIMADSTWHRVLAAARAVDPQSGGGTDDGTLSPPTEK